MVVSFLPSYPFRPPCGMSRVYRELSGSKTAGVAPLVMSERVFESLSAVEQEAVRLAAKRAVAAERETYRRAEESALEALGRLA